MEQQLSTGTAPASVMAVEAAKGRARPQPTRKANTRTKYIFRGEDGVDYLIETSEGYRNRKNLHLGRSSTLKKLGRISRVTNRGFTKRKASPREVKIYGPAINVAAE